MRKPPSYSDVHSGECEITIPHGTGTCELDISWEVEAESLSYTITRIRSLAHDGTLCIDYDREMIDKGRYLLPPSLKEASHDKAIREAIWNEIGSSIPTLPESHYVD